MTKVGIMSYLGALQNIVRTDRITGEAKSIDASVQSIVDELEFTLDEIRDGEWNGMPINDISKIPEYLELAIRPVLEAGTALLETVAENKGWTASLDVDPELRSQFGRQTVVDLTLLDEKLSDAFSTWLKSVNELDPQGNTGIPLPYNDVARKTMEVRDMRQVIRLQDDASFGPYKFVSDDAAQALRRRDLEQQVAQSRGIALTADS